MGLDKIWVTSTDRKSVCQKQGQISKIPERHEQHFLRHYSPARKCRGNKNMSPWQHDFQSDTVQVHFTANSRVSWGKYLEVALREEGD